MELSTYKICLTFNKSQFKVLDKFKRLVAFSISKTRNSRLELQCSALYK